MANRYSLRQNQIISLIATGHSNQEIAIHLGIDIRTVQGHLAPVRRDIGCGNNDYELALWAYLTCDQTMLRGHTGVAEDEIIISERVYAAAKPGTAWCSRCKGYLDQRLFMKNASRSNGLDALCKRHRAIAKRKWLHKVKSDPARWASLREQQHLFYLNRKHYEASLKYAHYGRASQVIQNRGSARA